MVEAYAKGGALAIRFKNGKTEKFRLAPSSAALDDAAGVTMGSKHRE
jgi:hypothetical protein